MSNFEEWLIKFMFLSGMNLIKLMNLFKVDNCLNEKKCVMKMFIRDLFFCCKRILFCLI